MRRLLVLLTALLGSILLATPAMAEPPVAPLGGGSTLYNPAGQFSGCTAGFAATRGSDWYLVAAGQGCGAVGTTLYSGNNIVVGPVTAKGADGLTIVHVTNHTNWTLVPWVGSGVTFSGATSPVVGAAVCLIGADSSSTGVHCGTITAVNVTVVFPEGTVNGLAATTVVVEPRSSAVTFVSGSKAEGVLVGSSTGTSYFHPIVQVLAQYGLQLLF